MRFLHMVLHAISGFYFPIIKSPRRFIQRYKQLNSSLLNLNDPDCSIYLPFSLLHLSLSRPYTAHSYASSRLLAATRVHFTSVLAVYQPLPTCHISDCTMWSLSYEAAWRTGHRYTTWHKNKGPHVVICIMQTYPKFIPRIFFCLQEKMGRPH